MLEKISMYDHSKGIDVEAYTDGYSQDEYSNLYLVSILGHDSAVKAISSAIVTLKDVMIYQDDVWLSFSAMRGEKYRIMSARLESGLLHQIVAVDCLFSQGNSSQKLIYVGDKRHTNNAVFNMIKKNFGTPLLPEWKNWLIRQIQRGELLEVMQGNVQLVRLNLTEKQLDEIVTEGIKQKPIRF